MRVKAVISRFGENVTGGAEKHCQDILQILPKHWNIEVLTTTAKDYITWKNEFKSGVETWKNISIHRFPVERKRNLKTFNLFTDTLREAFPNQTQASETEWLIQQGPYSPKLIEAIKNAESDTDLFLFFSYLYYPTVLGLSVTKTKSIIIPMFHDELPAYFSIYKDVFTPEKYYAFNSPEELELFEHIFGYTPKNKAVIGTYVALDQQLEEGKQEDSEEDQLKTLSVSEEYTLSVGRMDLGKGFSELIELYFGWLEKTENPIPLKIIGNNPPSIMKQYESQWVQFLGYVDENEKEKLIKHARLLINPSSLESFSIVLMESWAQSVPVLVNSKSLVLKGHCQRSNGGLYYTDQKSFSICMDMMLDNINFAKKMGHNGNLYVKINFSKEIIREKILGFIESTQVNS
ncbi:MAG: glycosyltransferase family 4 protein [Leptospira sp.]|nr:glycosyltransferase family 4 protein [Leptospira sp.]